jgi:hypothetical protein
MTTAVEDIRWLVARRAEALHRDPDEATTPPSRPSSTTDAVSISTPDVRTGSHRADKALERSFRPQRVAATLKLGPAFDTGKVMANLLSAYRVGPAFDTGKVMANLLSAYRVGPAFDTGKVMANLLSVYRVGPAFDTGKVMANLLSAYRVGPAFDTGFVRVVREPTSASPLMPTSPHGPIPAPADPGWLHQLLNDEERMRAVAPYLAFASGGCILVGLFLVALVDPTVRAALEILDAEAGMASLIVALIALHACQRR